MNENLPDNHNHDAVFQQDELRNNQQLMQQQQNSQDEAPAVISQENRTQINNNNRIRRMKWTKTLNTDIVRCYFNTVLRIESLFNHTDNSFTTDGQLYTQNYNCPNREYLISIEQSCQK